MSAGLAGPHPSALAPQLPTKQYWRAPSRLEYIDAGLLPVTEARRLQLRSLALPALPCGLGGGYGDDSGLYFTTGRRTPGRLLYSLLTSGWTWGSKGAPS